MKIKKSNVWKILAGICGFVLLYIVHINNYLLFHSIAEVFSIVIAFAIFIVVWNGRKYLQGYYLLILGIAYLFIGFLDLLHTLGYKGMFVFTSYDYYANQLWIAARFLEAITIVIAFLFIGSSKRISVPFLFGVYAVVSAALIYSIFFSDLFPVCYVEGQGQTPFKIGSEYAINVILVIGLVLLCKKRKKIEKSLFPLLVSSVGFTIISELAFTFYISNYGFSNMLGHFAKILSFYFIYQATVVKSIAEPYNTIFSELTDANEQKNELFSIIAHDLRGPLSGILCISESLVRYYDEFPEEQRMETIREIHKASNSTVDLVINLLYWARAEQQAATMDFQPCQVLDLAIESISALELVYKAKDIKLKIEIPDNLEITVDRDTFEIVLRNILSNAVKFSNEGSTVTIRARTENRRTVIEVQDEGIGMDVSTLEKTTVRFRTTHGTKGEKGAGLGLGLIGTYARRNKADLQISSEEGKGTVIRLIITIP